MASAMIELRIRWDGPVNGLDEHRLSVALFSIPLRKLLTAIRRTASNMLRESANRKETEFGRFAAEADQIDLEIFSLVDGSGGVASVVSVQVPSGQMGLWPDGLAEDALDRVLIDLDRESRGIRRNARARDFLESLPPSLTSQDYWLYVDGTERRHVQLGRVSLVTELSAVPYLVEITGRVISVGFAPGPNFVRLKASEDGSEITFHCSKEDVFRALEIHETDVRVLGLVRDGTKRLLRIQAIHEPRVRLNEKTWIFERWDGVLGRLAQ
jgi:hypothetical protein